MTSMRVIVGHPRAQEDGRFSVSMVVLDKSSP